MFRRIRKEVPYEVPIFDAKDYPKSYLISMISASKNIFGRQCEKIKKDIDRVKKAISIQFKGRPQDNTVIVEFLKSIEDTLEAWYSKNKILPIINSKKLNMLDVYYQS